ncbi:MAG: methionyl-tRNA formyltransferase [Gammaproteobacteria bacterium]|nr:methionyl-tRNA formyltransferase [Gammaproteobacteria bacterium]|tara:strand:+ start:22841 stop:23776 length:936 start_codon:yes stop_codon:yes gene_type:complete
MSKTKIKIGFAGTPKVAFDIFREILLSEEISTEFVLTQPDKLSGRGLTTSKSLFENSDNLTVLQPDDLNEQNFIKKIKDFNIDLLVVVAYGKILPAWLLTAPRFGCLNIHFSNLPKYRGAAPIQRAIENGEKETGISFMRLTEGLDEGPVYKKIVMNIENKDYFEVESLLLKESLNNIRNVIKAITNGLKPKEQDHSKASIANKIHKNEGEINWANKGSEIKNKFLAFKKWPNVFFKCGGVSVEAVELQIHSNETGTPGEVHNFDHESLKIYCGDGIVAITSVKFPGKKVIGPKDFFNSKRDIISKGDLLI